MYTMVIQAMRTCFAYRLITAFDKIKRRAKFSKTLQLKKAGYGLFGGSFWRFKTPILWLFLHVKLCKGESRGGREGGLRSCTSQEQVLNLFQHKSPFPSTTSPFKIAKKVQKFGRQPQRSSEAMCMGGAGRCFYNCFKKTKLQLRMSTVCLIDLCYLAAMLSLKRIKTFVFARQASR